MEPNDPADKQHCEFDFEYTVALFAGKTDSRWVSEGVNELRILGRIRKGKIIKGSPVSLPTKSGTPFLGTVVQFMDEFHDWSVLPWCGSLVDDGNVFCLVIGHFSSHRDIICPAVAAWPPPSTPD